MHLDDTVVERQTPCVPTRRAGLASSHCVNWVYTADPPLREPDVKRTDWGVCPWGTKRMAGALFYYVNDPNSVNLELRERTSPRVQFS